MPGQALGRLESLVRVCESAGWSAKYEDIFQNIADALAENLSADRTSIHLFDFNSDLMMSYASHPPAQAEQSQVPPTVLQRRMTIGRIKWLIATHQPIVMDYLDPHPDDIPPDYALEMGIKCAVTVPLLSAGEALGVYTVSYCDSRKWEQGDLDYLCAIGRILGAVIQRAQMSRKHSEMMILNERRFLSTEIHDNLSQSISSLKLGVETALMLYEDGKTEDLRETLEWLEGVGQQAVAQLREEMLTLRPPLSETDGLVSGLRESLARFQGRSLVEAQLSIVGEEEPSVSIQCEQQILRILHEALSNVLRHAAAKRVEVRLMRQGRRLQMRIIDDGRGFDPAAVPAERLGLKIMRERAEQMGGTCQVQSTLGKGTTIFLEMPCII